MYNTQQLNDIQLIQDFIHHHNRSPKYHENKITPGFPNGAYFRKSFGTLNKAIIAAGHQPDSETDPITGKHVGTTKTFTCSQCNREIVLTGKKLNEKLSDVKKRDNTHVFCNHSCAASYTNRMRVRMKTPKISFPKKVKETNKEPELLFSKVYTNKCAHCGTISISRSKRKYCKEHIHLYGNENRNRFAFSFSLSQYPDIFTTASSLITQFGMWSYKNSTGVTRDHKISVNMAIKHGYDPFYIKHPLNCELMSWTENNQKKTKCSITYEHLVEIVDAYEAKRTIRRLPRLDSNQHMPC